jgi:prepilin-type N-terminal cleavage/methylation domain-containing protein
MKKKQQKGFTLIELLVVIAIIAILSIVVVLTLNPAEMLRRSRDSNRISDLGTIKTAISLYLVDVSTTPMGTAGLCYASNAAAFGTVYEFTGAETGSPVSATTCATWFPTATAVTSSLSRAVTGTGWIPINLSAISSGAPIGQWPIDPSNTAGSGTPATGPASAGHFYSYIGTSTNNGFKLATKMESVNYSNGGTNDVESTDGGSGGASGEPYMYEQGSNLGL